MEIKFKETFFKDIRKIPRNVKDKLLRIISKFEKVSSIFEVSNIKKIQGFKRLYRIKIGDFRLGIQSKGKTIIFMRLLHRKDIYKYFP